MSMNQYEQWPNNSANVQYIALKKLLMRAESRACLEEACEGFSINRQSGAAINLRRWTNPDPDTTTNNTGVSKASRKLDYVDYTGTMGRYDESFMSTAYNEDLNPYSALEGGADVLGDWLIPETRELVRYNAAKSITTILYNSPAISTRLTVNGTITGGRLQVAVRGIRGYRGRYFTGIEGGQNKEGTSPVEEALWAYCSSDLEPDLRKLPGFKTVAEYPAGKGEKNEFGAWQNIRFRTSPTYVAYANAATSVSSTTLISTGTTGTTAGSPDVYPIVILAKGALASVKLSGNGAEGFGNAKINYLDKPDKSDVNNDRRVVAASWYDLCLVTSNQWGCVIEVAATRNPA